MPLLDHFHQPLSAQRPWEGFHSTWAAAIAEHLNEFRLPERYVALPQVRRGTALEVDVATLREPPAVYAGVASSSVSPWSPSQPAWVGEIDGADRDWFEVRIVESAGGPRLVAAIELVSPANKDRPAHRQAFAGKCAGYLRQGIGLIVVDVVTDRHESLQRAIQDMLELDAAATLDSRLFAAAYRTVPKEETLQLEIWSEGLSLGHPLPTLPLWLEADLAVPVDFEATYAVTCRRLRIRPESDASLSNPRTGLGKRES